MVRRMRDLRRQKAEGKRKRKRTEKKVKKGNYRKGRSVPF